MSSAAISSMLVHNSQTRALLSVLAAKRPAATGSCSREFRRRRHQVLHFHANHALKAHGGEGRYAVLCKPCYLSAPSGRSSRCGFSYAKHYSSIAASSGSASDQNSDDVDAMMRGEVSDDMMKRINAATNIIGEMIAETSKDIFVADPNSDTLSVEEEADAERDAVRKSVAKRMDILDEVFLITLAGFVRSAADEKDTAMHRRISLIHQQVLAEVSSRLPSEVQLLDRLISMNTSEERITTLKACMMAVTSPSSPDYLDVRRLEAAAAQFIEDMEDKAEVPDRKLLARMCLVREEVQNTAREVAFSRGESPYQPATEAIIEARGGVSRRAVAFLQAVMKVPTPAGRAAYLRKAFRSDWEGAAPVRSAPGTVSDGDEKSDAVRPGRFLTALSSLQVELTKEGSNIELGVLERIEEIRRETFDILAEMT